jgi:hypothetical protein
VIDPAAVDLEMLVQALSDQGFDGEWRFDPRTGETGYWSSDVDNLDETDETTGDGDDVRVRVEPLPSYIWYQDMVDFTEQLSDEHAAQRLARALRGKGAFRRFKDELHQEYPDLVEPWYAFRDNRGDVRAVEWLWDNGLVSYETYQQFKAEHPDPAVP